MQSISRLHTRKYIFPPMVRKYYNICGVLTSIGLLCFALLMWGVGIKQTPDKIPCFAVAAIFTMIHIGCTVIWVRNYHLINSMYHIDDYIAINFAGKTHIKTSVDMSSSIRTDYRYSFHLGYASFDMDCFIYSNSLHSDDMMLNIEAKNIYQITRKIWEYGSVIVPKTS